MKTFTKILIAAGAAAVATVVVKKVIDHIRKENAAGELDIQRAYQRMKERWSRQEEEKPRTSLEEALASAAADEEEEGLEFSFTYDDADYLGDQMVPPAPVVSTDISDDVFGGETDDGELTEDDLEFLRQLDGVDEEMAENAEMTEEEIQAMVAEEMLADEIESILAAQDSLDAE